MVRTTSLVSSTLLALPSSVVTVMAFNCVHMALLRAFKFLTLWNRSAGIYRSRSVTRFSIIHNLRRQRRGRRIRTRLIQLPRGRLFRQRHALWFQSCNLTFLLPVSPCKSTSCTPFVTFPASQAEAAHPHCLNPMAKWGWHCPRGPSSSISPPPPPPPPSPLSLSGVFVAYVGRFLVTISPPSFRLPHFRITTNKDASRKFHAIEGDRVSGGPEGSVNIGFKGCVVILNVFEQIYLCHLPTLGLRSSSNPTFGHMSPSSSSGLSYTNSSLSLFL